VIANLYNKKTKGPILMVFFTATGKLKVFFFFVATGDVRCVHHGWHGTHWPRFLGLPTRIPSCFADFAIPGVVK